MNIIIAGCGKIGSTILQSFVAEGHDIVAIDVNPDVITDITNVYDVMGVCGNGADCEILAEAGISEAELFIAAAGSDELNMLSCLLAGKMGAHHTIARIRNPEYNDSSLGFIKSELKLSMSINPDRLAAYELFNILKLPSAVKIETFSNRNLEMVEIRLKDDSALDGMTLIEMRNRYHSRFLVCTVQRDDKVYIPDGNFVLKSGDRIGFTASQNEIQKLLRSLGLLQKQAKTVMILGGSRTAFYLAQMLTGIGIDAKVIEKDKTICDEFSEAIPDAVIINGDGAEQELLFEEGLHSTDAFVALTGMDEQNILLSFCALSQNVPKVISKVNRDELAEMAGKLGLDCIVSPTKIVADVLVRYARALENSLGSNVETLYKLNDGMAEALEFNAKPDTKIVGIPLKELKLKSNILIGGIIRDRKTIIPNGDDMILGGDRVIVIATDKRLQDLSDILKQGNV